MACGTTCGRADCTGGEVGARAHRHHPLQSEKVGRRICCASKSDNASRRDYQLEPVGVPLPYLLLLSHVRTPSSKMPSAHRLSEDGASTAPPSRPRRHGNIQYKTRVRHRHSILIASRISSRPRRWLGSGRDSGAMNNGNPYVSAHLPGDVQLMMALSPNELGARSPGSLFDHPCDTRRRRSVFR
jgi:hypothetical protein